MNKKTTIVRWFSELDPREHPWKYQALRNTLLIDYYENCYSLKGAILSAFHWASTSEGHEFWCGIWEQV